MFLLLLVLSGDSTVVLSPFTFSDTSKKSLSFYSVSTSACAVGKLNSWPFESYNTPQISLNTRLKLRSFHVTPSKPTYLTFHDCTSLLRQCWDWRLFAKRLHVNQHWGGRNVTSVSTNVTSIVASFKRSWETKELSLEGGSEVDIEQNITE